MTRPSETRRDAGAPLWSMGLIVMFLLGVPVVLYSIAPSGPIREGDTVFSAGAVTVSLAHPSLYDRDNFDGTCLLDPRDPLMVIQRPSDRTDGSALVRVQGKTKTEWPFCPPQAEIVVAIRQIVQKPDALAEMMKSLRCWWSQ